MREKPPKSSPKMRGRDGLPILPADRRQAAIIEAHARATGAEIPRDENLDPATGIRSVKVGKQADPVDNHHMVQTYTRLGYEVKESGPYFFELSISQEQYEKNQRDAHDRARAMQREHQSAQEIPGQFVSTFETAAGEEPDVEFFLQGGGQQTVDDSVPDADIVRGGKSR
jgi:hypothetical protein